mmetsp:Transcript_103521/g.183912  ORF Transcript_103521/g.183912 Transcript_103521/m.183912 type:complete len:91 (-) Transcript_103521:91-363(-)
MQLIVFTLKLETTALTGMPSSEHAAFFSMGSAMRGACDLRIPQVMCHLATLHRCLPNDTFTAWVSHAWIYLQPIVLPHTSVWLGMTVHTD